jgi:hypothetical protein
MVIILRNEDLEIGAGVATEGDIHQVILESFKLPIRVIVKGPAGYAMALVERAIFVPVDAALVKVVFDRDSSLRGVYKRTQESLNLLTCLGQDAAADFRVASPTARL